MFKLFFIIFIFFISVDARENPFSSTEKNNILVDASKKSKVLFYNYGKIYIDDKSLKIWTKDTLKKRFLLLKPYRMVFDFARDSDMGTKYIRNLNGAFKNIVLGSHQKYYRIVIELDSSYRYKNDTISNGYTITAIPKE